MPIRFLLAVAAALQIGCTTSKPQPESYPPAMKTDYIIPDFHFQSGETLPELRIRYRTLGTPQRDASGTVRNAVLILHGTPAAAAGF